MIWWLNVIAWLVFGTFLLGCFGYLAFTPITGPTQHGDDDHG